MWRVVVIVLLSVVAMGAQGKGQIVQIDLHGGTLEEPVVVRDWRVLQRFSIWNGPGSYSSARPRYFGALAGRADFVDWTRGEPPQVPKTSVQLEVSFHIPRRGLGVTKGDATYEFTYVYDSSTDCGYIFLPKRNRHFIMHGVEGTWRYATRAWNETVREVLER